MARLEAQSEGRAGFAEPIGTDLAVLTALAPAHATNPMPALARPSARRPDLLDLWQRFRAAVVAAITVESDYGGGFLFVPVLIGLGALAWFSLPFEPGTAPVAFLLCVFCTGWFVYREAPAWPRVVLTAASLVMGGMALAAVETARKATVLLDMAVTTTVEGRVTGRESDDRGRWRYRVDLLGTREPALGRLPDTAMLMARSRHVPFAVGDIISGRARLSPPSGPALPDLNDFAFDAYFRGIGATGYFYGAPVRPDTAIATGQERSMFGRSVGAFFDGLAAIREKAGRRIRETIGGDAGAIAAALVTAEERSISRETVEALRQAGLAHVLAISGLNMVLAAGTFLVGARTLLSMVPGLAHRVAIKKLAAAGAILMVTFYILISGGAVSAVRSWIMIVIMLAAILFDRPSISLRNVALAGIVILVVTPSSVTGPGFQMSFAATLALVAGYSRWRGEGIRHDADLPAIFALGGIVSRFFIGLAVSSLIGGLSTTIYSAGHFHRLAAYGLAGNMLAMPVIGIVVMPMALLSMLLMPLGLDRWPLLAMGEALDLVIAIAHMVASWGGDTTTGRINGTAFLLIALGGIVACLLRTWLAASGGVIILAGIVALFFGAGARPSVTVSEDGRLVALIAGPSAAISRAKPPSFVFDQWQRALAISDIVRPLDREDLIVPLPEEPKGRRTLPVDGQKAQRPDPAISAAVKLALTETPKGRFACVGKQFCVATALQGWRIVTVEDPRFTGAACSSADLVVTPMMLRLKSCRSGARLVTGRSLRRTGALEITREAEGSGMIVEGAVGTPQRPWSRHRLYDWRSRSFEPDDPEANISERNDTPPNGDASEASIPQS